MEARVKKRRATNEADLQEAIVNYCHLQYPHVTILHIPNGGKRGYNAQREVKRNGTLKGVSDLFIAKLKIHHYDVADTVKGGLWIEVKSATGRLRVEQAYFLDKMKQKGYETAVIYDLDSAIKIIDQYLK